MAEVMTTPSTISLPSEHQELPHDLPTSRPVGSRRPQQPRERIPSYAESRMSSYSKRSRPHSAALPLVQSSLPYALVRDFAYPSFHPMHLGGPPEHPSGASTPPSEWGTGRRMSDSAEGGFLAGRGTWSAGPWADGKFTGDPEEEMEPLPSTSFGTGDDWSDHEVSGKTTRKRHRRSRSYADAPDYERGRRRESASNRNSDFDPAGRDALRQSRGFEEHGDVRRDSHFATGGTLPSRSYHTSQPLDPDEDIPLDAEPSTQSPQRESIGPEDEELFAGPSLALYSFEPENDNELRLTEGQTILVSYRHGQGWLVAENPATGEQGLVPEQYVRLLRDIEGWDEERGGFIDDEELIGGMDTSMDRSESYPLDVKVVPDSTFPRDKDIDYDVELEKLSLREK